MNRPLAMNTSTSVPGSKPYAALAELFEAQAERYADRIALVFGDQRLTYRTLNARADALASRLQSVGVRAETPVALFFERSIELVVSILAVIKAGGAYVPLYVGSPPLALRHIVRDCGIRIAIVGSGPAPPALVEEIPIILEGTQLPDGATGSSFPALPDQLAYIMYTSGSTGVSKGVCVTQKNVVKLALDSFWRNDAQERILLHSSPAFDASTYEIWVPLLNGGQLVIAPPGIIDARLLNRLIRRDGVTGIWLTAGLFHAISKEANSCLAEVRQVIAGGDVLSAEAVETVRSLCQGIEVVNGYGPTETTTFATRYVVSDTTPRLPSIPIGTPLDDTEVYLLDDTFRQVKEGEVGELFIGGNGVARGYLNRPALTAASFVANPFGPPGSRLYRTGDLARKLPGGELYFVGRSDRQIKLRGFRVELGEIESVLRRCPDVRDVAVTVREDPRGSKRLAAYIAPQSMPSEYSAAREDSVVANIRAWTEAHLPEYMVPRDFMLLEKLPLTSNDKIDLAALPLPPRIASTELMAELEATPQEEILMTLFRDELGLEHVSVDDDFILLGGDSLTAAAVAVRATKEGVVLTPLQILNERTIRQLVAVVGQDISAGNLITATIPPELLSPILTLREGGDFPPLFCIHPASGLSWPYTRLLRHLRGNFPIYGLQERHITESDYLPDSIEQVAFEYVRRIRSIQKRGPYRLLGWCLGGAIASAMTALLEADCELVSFLGIIDYFPGQFTIQSDIRVSPDADERTNEAQEMRVIGEFNGDYFDISPILFDQVSGENAWRMIRRYQPSPIRAPLTLFRAAKGYEAASNRSSSWQPYVNNHVDAYDIPCSHGLLLNLRYAEQIARILQKKLDALSVT